MEDLFLRNDLCGVFLMSIKEKFEELREKLFGLPIPVNRNYEFEAELEDHPLGNQNIYRLRYVNYHRIGENWGMRPDNLGVIESIYDPFVLPLGMEREDAFKILSYLIDFIEEKYELRQCSEKGVYLLNSMLFFEELGFRKLSIKLPRNSDDVADLFTVSGRLLLFQNSDEYSRYFEWYTEGVTFEDVCDIYDKIGVDFSSLEVLDTDLMGYSRKLSRI